MFVHQKLTVCTDQEIKKALVHRARLRKQYLKDLKEQGEELPEKAPRKENEEKHNRPYPKPNYQERAEIAKKRKEVARKEREAKRQEYTKNAEKKRAEREKKKELLSQKTRTGQPLMGPRIANLLEKIKNED